MGQDDGSSVPRGALRVAEGVDRPRLAPLEVERVRRSRRHPRRTDFDYLHLRTLVADIEAALAAIPGPVEDVLDAFCGTRPYEDMLPAGARCTGFDIDNHYGSADVTGHDFLPFGDACFDLVLCISGFHYLPDPSAGAAEIGRVLRPGGTVLLTVPLVWEYDRTIPEQRFTGPQLAAFFESWDDVRVVENGGRAVSWALLTGHLIYLRQRMLSERRRKLLSPAFSLAYAAVNGLGLLAERVLRDADNGAHGLPPNLLLTARRRAD